MIAPFRRKVFPRTSSDPARSRTIERPERMFENGRSSQDAGVLVSRQNEKVFALRKWLARRLLRRVGDPPIALELCDGERIDAGGKTTPVAVVHIHDRRTLLELLIDPELAFGDAYSDGRIEVEGDLLTFLEIADRAISSTFTSDRFSPMRILPGFLAFGSNTIARSRRHVHHHYDIDECFYRLWLDEQMVYTCAYFSEPTTTLEQAQRAKMDYVCRKLRLQPGDEVVEAGFGWGALALHMARHYGVRVTACNLSHEQTLFARARARNEGLDARVEFVEDDYRNLSGRFDAFVSVGMLEHVGREHHAELGRVIDRCLARDGRGLIHSIGRNQPRPFRGWAGRRIFPGAYPPSLREMLDVLEPHGFSVMDVENLRQHYARTLEQWLARYCDHEDEVAGMFDDRFVRMWRLYLTGSIAAFNTGSLQLFQITFTRPGTGCVPWSRSWLYEQ